MYEKVSRKVLSSKKSKVHDGVDFAPSICLGLYVDRSLQAPPVIEMAFLNNSYGLQAAMHFQSIIPQVIPKVSGSDLSTSKTAKVLGALGGGKRRNAGGVFSNYVESEQVRLKSAVQRSSKATVNNAVAANLREIIKFNDPTPGGTNPPAGKPESPEKTAMYASDSVSFTNLGVIADLAEGKVSAATAKMAIEAAGALKTLYDQATQAGNPVAVETWDYIQGRAVEIASRISHPEDLSKMAGDVRSYIDETEYLSLNLFDVEILTVDVSKPPSKELTENPYNFDHDFEVMGMFWRFSSDGAIVPDGYLSHRELASQGFEVGAGEFREHQAMMPRDSREFVMKGDIPAKYQPAATNADLQEQRSIQAKNDAPAPRSP
jgi:hypothetical protein